ncbi:MAG: acetoin utilization protein AcuC, partial [Candidatus Thermoplasmatota archaeon]|nr:acetoin utilization protein AcuC [Candidatus Thermoplasmatota archaeon]
MLPSLLIYDERFLDYNFGPAHPFQQGRVKLARDLMAALGLLDHEGSPEETALPASEDHLLLAHAAEYLEVVRRAGRDPARAGDRYLRYGLGTADNPLFPGMYEAAALAAGGTLAAMHAVQRGEVRNAFNLGGGFHHAHRARASGFCIFNDLSVAIHHLLQEGVSRILYLDVDAHHGDGVQYAFYEDPRVLTISLHEDGRYLFPGTGFVEEVGEGEGEGYSVNVPLPPQTGDEAYLAAFREIVPPLAEAFRPELLLNQFGIDTYVTDPLTHLGLGTSAYQAIAREVHTIADRVCGGRWVVTGGGGYEPSAVARAWALVFGEMRGSEMVDPIPEDWESLYRTLFGRELGTKGLVD